MNKQVCTFTLDDMLFGVDVPVVQEVLRPQPMARVPLAPPVVKGLINLRGQILTAIDLRERLGFPPAPKEVSGMNLVVRLPDETVSFIVDDVGEVLNLADEQFEEAPPTLHQTISDVTSGIYKLKGRLLLLLNVNAAATLPSDRN
jgi:purine-binding chemotaxis protein CheW